MHCLLQMRLELSIKISFLALAVGLAATASSSAWAKSRWYQVEVIVFRQTDPGAAGGERWPDLKSFPDFRNSVDLFVDLPEFSDEPEAHRPNEVSVPGPLAFQSLRPGSLKLSGVLRRLRGLGAYEPVLHVGWRQPGLSASRARSVYISDKPAARVDTAMDATALASGPQVVTRRVEGMIRVRTGRLLNVDADFVSYDSGAVVRLTERRKVKLRELHYFDHPLFGVLVQVTPYHITPPSGESGESEEAASSESP